MTRLGYLDALRGIAALLVVIVHLWYPLLGPDALPGLWLDIGKLGVIWFFLISGVVIPFSLQPGPGGARRFIVSRGLRLYPAYWMSMALFISMLALNAEALPSWQRVLANLTMLQAALGFEDVMGLYWTLFVEWLFYALCLGLMLFGKLRSTGFRTFCALGLLGMALAMGLARGLLERKLPVALPLGLSLMLFGSIWRDCLLGQANNQIRRCIHLLLLAYALVLPVTFYAAYSFDAGHGEYWFRYLFTYAVAIVSFLLLTLRIRLHHPLLLWLGTISYSLYLLHPSIELLCRYLLGSSGLSVAVALLATALSLLVAHLSYRFVELPFIQLSKRLNARARNNAPLIPELQVPYENSDRP